MRYISVGRWLTVIMSFAFQDQVLGVNNEKSRNRVNGKQI
jgi:hypothetical protein